jgi:hypothetical protein
MKGSGGRMKVARFGFKKDEFGCQVAIGAPPSLGMRLHGSIHIQKGSIGSLGTIETFPIPVKTQLSDLSPERMINSLFEWKIIMFIVFRVGRMP